MCLWIHIAEVYCQFGWYYVFTNGLHTCWCDLNVFNVEITIISNKVQLVEHSRGARGHTHTYTHTFWSDSIWSAVTFLYILENDSVWLICDWNRNLYLWGNNVCVCVAFFVFPWRLVLFFAMLQWIVFVNTLICVRKCCFFFFQKFNGAKIGNLIRFG